MDVHTHMPTTELALQAQHVQILGTAHFSDCLKQTGLCSYLLKCSVYFAPACLTLPAAGVPEEPAIPRQLWCPHGRWWPGLPSTHTGALLTPSSLANAPPFPSPSEQTYVTPPYLGLLLCKAGRKEQLILPKPREGK